MSVGPGCHACHNSGIEKLDTTHPYYTLVPCSHCAPSAHHAAVRNALGPWPTEGESVKITDDMAAKAVDHYEHEMSHRGFDTGDCVDHDCMKRALEAAFSSYEREHSRWERFSPEEIDVLRKSSIAGASALTHQARGEYTARLEAEMKAVLANESIPKFNRWSSFSDEEVRELTAAASDRWKSPSLPAEIHEQTGALARELMTEDNRRAGGYQGPGFYAHAPGSEDSREYEVLGTLHIGNTYVVMRQDHGLFREAMEEFNQSMGEERGPRFRYLRPLKEES